MPLPSSRWATVPAAASSLTAGLLRGPPTTATVLAAYPFGLYLDVAGSVLPVVTADAVPLATALRLAGRAGSVDWSVRVGDRVQVGDGRVVLPSVALVVARTWRPARVTRTSASRASVATHTVLPVDPYATSASRGCVEGAGADWLADGIRDAVRSADPEPPVRAVLGRGPGLTPSGDDALAGALLVCHGLGCGARLVAAVRERRAATTAVSAALLTAAADGYAARPVVRFVDAVLAGDAGRVDAALPAVLDIGHSSGRDLLTGVGAAVRALAAAQPAPVAAGQPSSPADGQPAALGTLPEAVGRVAA
jgi:hypothetical protein